MAAMADADVSIDVDGNIRWEGAATTNRHSVLEFIQFLQDKQDDQQAAGNIFQKLILGEDFATLAEEHSEHAASKDKGGELGLVTRGDFGEALDEVIFSADTEIGTLIGPIRDEEISTKGGYWLVKVVDKDDNREIDEEDRNYLLNQAYNDWVSELWVESADGIDDSNLTPEIRQWVIDQIMESII